MKDELTRRQMINSELATRASNRKSVKVLRHHVPQEEQKDLKIEFACECADRSCRARIPLTLAEYEKLHKNHARFVVANGHVEPIVEKVTHVKDRLTVVEKYALE